MKKSCFLLLFATLSSFIYAQTAAEMLTEISGKWQLDDNGNVTFVRVIELPDMDKVTVYNRALNYFTYNYVSGKAVIQTQDIDNGFIVGKGIYDNVHIGYSIITTIVDAWHILRVDIKEGKLRVLVTLTQYEKKMVGGSTPPTYSTSNISNEYPINLKGWQKTVMSKAFYKTYQKAMSTLDGMERAVKEGSTSKNIENSDW
jgi:hypothetical protein